MAVFDESKFMNFYGFAPKSLHKTQAEKSNSPLAQPWVSGLTIGSYAFDIPPVITMNLKKNVVTTKIAGSSRPPLVEIIGYDTFTIKIQGYMENALTFPLSSKPGEVNNGSDTTGSKGEVSIRDNQFPVEKLRKLHEIFKKNEALSVKSNLLDIFGISRIVITDMPDITYYPTAFTYIFNAIADEHQEILVLEK